MHLGTESLILDMSKFVMLADEMQSYADLLGHEVVTKFLAPGLMSGDGKRSHGKPD